MEAIPSRVWIEIFQHFDEASLRRATWVCKEWAKNAKEVLWCQPSGKMLDELRPYSCDFVLPNVHTLVLKRPQDFDLRLRFPNLRHLVIDNGALQASRAVSLAELVQRFCEPPRPSRVTIYDSFANNHLDLRHWAFEQDWLRKGDVAFLARRPGLKYLTVAPSLLHPTNPPSEYKQLVGQRAFRDLRLLVTRVWSFSAAGLMRLVPNVEVLVLEVPNDDHLEGCVLHAVAATLRGLRELTVTYANRFAVRDSDVESLSRFRQLRVLELRGSIEGEEWRPLFAKWNMLQPLLTGLTYLVRLWLPTPREWFPPEALSIIGQHCQQLRYVRLLTTWDSESLRDSQTNPVFPLLKTLVINSVGAPMLYEAESACRARGFSLVRLLRSHAPELRTLRMHSPTLLDVYVFGRLQKDFGKEVNDDPWMACKANLAEGEWY